MNITLNGQQRQLPGAANINEIIARFCRQNTHVVAEVNGEIVQRSRWDLTVLKEGDRVELIHFVGGG